LSTSFRKNVKHLNPSVHALRHAWKPLGTATLGLTLLAGCATGSHNTEPAIVPPPTAAAAAASGSLVQTLTGHHWQLAYASDAQGNVQAGWEPSGPGVQGKHIQLDFTSDGMLSVQNLCNQLAGRYTIDGNRILVEQVISSLRACASQPLMELERRVGARISQLASWQLQPAQGNAPPWLKLSFTDGGSWSLQGKPTPATLYGNAGVREFLEIAPQRERCTGVAPMECLKVRKIQYDGQGLKTEVGPWELFYSEIEGYRHEPGVRNVLRVQRYERSKAPADASRSVYILDMVVESEIVKPR